MPKILQRTLLISITNYLCFLVFYYIIYIIVGLVLNDKPGALENWYSALFFFILALEFYETRIPDYIFIAPFSKSERIALQKKLFLYKHFASWLVTSVITAFPGLVTSIINKNIYSLFKAVFVIAVTYFLLFAAGHFQYFKLVNKKNYTFTGLLTDIIILIDSSVIAAIITETEPGMFTHIFIAATGISAILVSLYCYKKHYKDMLEFYSDYELRTQQSAAPAGGKI